MADYRYVLLGGLLLLLIFGCIGNNQQQSKTQPSSQPTVNDQQPLNQLGDSDINPTPTSDVTLPSENAVLSDSQNTTSDVLTISNQSDVVLANENVLIEPQ